MNIDIHKISKLFITITKMLRKVIIIKILVVTYVDCVYLPSTITTIIKITIIAKKIEKFYLLILMNIHLIFF